MIEKELKSRKEAEEEIPSNKDGLPLSSLGNKKDLRQLCCFFFRTKSKGRSPRREIEQRTSFCVSSDDEEDNSKE